MQYRLRVDYFQQRAPKHSCILLYALAIHLRDPMCYSSPSSRNLNSLLSPSLSLSNSLPSASLSPSLLLSPHLAFLCSTHLLLPSHAACNYTTQGVCRRLAHVLWRCHGHPCVGTQAKATWWRHGVQRRRRCCISRRDEGCDGMG